MENKIAENAVLDYAAFQVSWSGNSYKALICSSGIIENLGSGPLDQLVMHLPEAKSSCSNPIDSSFKLQVDESMEASSWFTKFIVERFLHVVNAPNELKLANAIENEIRQLDETRRFHIALYAKDNSSHFGGEGTDVNNLTDAGLTHQIKIETASSDATKNELLRAMDLRLAALKEELAACFNRAIGTVFCSNQISDLALFAQHFGAEVLSNSLLKFMELCPNNLHFDMAMKQQSMSNDSKNINQTSLRKFSSFTAKSNAVKPATPGVSPAKVALAERQNSSESENSSDSSDTDIPNGERSRPVTRLAAPRRSASPMRRVQIGRSGSRRSTAIAIKSLSYFASKEKGTSNKDADQIESGNDEIEQLPKKPENNATRISVQDAISLFERKQKDENVDIQKRKTAEVSISANKSVLRRWSAGMGSSFNYSKEEKPSESGHQIASSKLDLKSEDKEEDEAKGKSLNSENVPVISTEIIVTESLQVETSAEPVNTSYIAEVKDVKSAEWKQKQEAELNDMLTKMMESNKSSKFHCAEVGNNNGLFDASMDKRGGFYSQYKEKRDEKLRAENARNHAAKEAQFKAMHETLEQSKAAMASKTAKSADFSQKPRRNSSPPILSKKEPLKPFNTKNFSPKSSSPKTTNSLPSGLKRRGGSPAAKSSSVLSSNGIPSRQKPHPLNSPGQPSPRAEKPPERIKENKINTIAKTDDNPNSKWHENRQSKTVAKNSKAVKPRSPLTGEDCTELSKPTAPNKYTKKSSVVPVEAKPFLRKGSGIGTKAKDTRAPKSDDSSKNGENFVQRDNGLNTAPTMKVMEDDLQPTTVADPTVAAPLDDNDDDDIYVEMAENGDSNLTETNNGVIENSVVPMISEIQCDDDLGISSAAWVETDHQNVEFSLSRNKAVPVVSSISRVRHSLSQMLQAENGEPEVIEWGNAENPPSLVYQKEAPKGLKRLLKFARKSKGEGNSTGWSSPSVFSEGEEEHEESKMGNKASEAQLQKASLQDKGFKQGRNMVGESLDGGNSSKRAIDYRMIHGISSGSDKLRSGHIATAGTATKATRSFFSLSSFRSSKSNAKP